MKNLDKKVVVITGAGSGIGRELALRFALEGSYLALSDINDEGLAETVALTQLSENRVATFIVDVSDREATEQFSRNVVARFGQVDVLVNNAGLTVHGALDEVSYEAFERVINVNMWGVVYGTRAFLPHLRKRPEAVLANVASINAMVPFIDNGPYNMSKYAVYGLNETLMMELKGSTVHMLSIHPGGIQTNIANSALGMSEEKKSGFNDFAMTSATQAATAIVRAVKSKKSYLFIGRDAKLLQWLKRFFPAGTLRLSRWLTIRIAAKPD